MNRHPWKAVIPALVLAAALALAIVVLEHQPAAPRPMSVDELLVEPVVSHGVDALRVTVWARETNAMIRVDLQDPASNMPVFTRNTTSGASLDLPLAAAPSLFLVRAHVHETQPCTLIEWGWKGRAHLLLATSPEELARWIQEDAR